MTAAHGEVPVLQVFEENKLFEEQFQLYLTKSHTKCYHNDDFQLAVQ